MTLTSDAPEPVCRSRRFVRRPDDAFVNNLAALWLTHPELAGTLDAMPLPSDYQLLPTPEGVPTATVATGQGVTILLHSAHRPLAEARRLVEDLETEDRCAFAVYGLGLGYHLEAVVEKAGASADVWLFEPSLKTLRFTFEHRDLSKILGSGKLHIHTRPEKRACFDQMNQHSAAINLGFDAVSHQPSLQLQPESHQQFTRIVADFKQLCRTNQNTLLYNGRRTAENITRNILKYGVNGGLRRLRNAYRDKPAVIVSAGPSLRKNKHLLANAKGHAAVICVQTALRTMLELGVEPDFVTSLDFHDLSAGFFKGLPPGCRTELVAEAKASPAVIEAHPGPLTLCGNGYADLLLAGLTSRNDNLRAGSTVAHLAFYLAEYMGCSPIIFVGQDLGFSDGLFYAPGTPYDDTWRPEINRYCTFETRQWERIARNKPILRRVEDYRGRPTFADERLFTYLQHFERDFLASCATVIDATEGGVLKRGTTVMPFAEALQAYCSSPLPAGPPTHVPDDMARAVAVRRELELRREEARRILDISRRTAPLLAEIRDNVEDQTRVNRAIARIDKLREEIFGLDVTYRLITQLSQQSELERFKQDRRIAAAELEGRQRQRRQVERDLANVQAVATAAEQFIDLLSGVLDEPATEAQTTRRAA
ncbi:MAG: motility associated factor glycosyltransferase family protein [Phycisphaerae bacterium]